MDHDLRIAKKEDYNTGRNVRRFQLIVNEAIREALKKTIRLQPKWNFQ